MAEQYPVPGWPSDCAQGCIWCSSPEELHTTRDWQKCRNKTEILHNSWEQKGNGGSSSDSLIRIETVKIVVVLADQKQPGTCTKLINHLWELKASSPDPWSCWWSRTRVPLWDHTTGEMPDVGFGITHKSFQGVSVTRTDTQRPSVSPSVNHTFRNC